MTKNPIINAISASGYIVLVAAVLNYISANFGDKPDTVFAPVIFLSLLTLSVVMMAFFFFYQPIQLFVDGKKKEGIKLFVRTLGFFAIFTIVALSLMLVGVI